MQGVAEKVDLSKTGKSYRVKVGDAWYGAKKDTGIEQMRGKLIKFTVESGEYGQWITDPEVVSGGPAAANSSVGPSSDRFYMSFVSNVVAHCIQAGLIKEPKDIGSWAKAAHDTAQALDGGE